VTTGADETSAADDVALLGLQAGAARPQIEAALRERLGILQTRIDSAPTPALKAKFERQAAELGALGRRWGLVEPGQQLSDLPVLERPLSDEQAFAAGPDVAAEPSPEKSEGTPATNGARLAARLGEPRRPAMGAALAKLDRGQWAAMAAGAAAAVAAVLTYPLWEAATPWRAAAEKAELSRLAGVVGALATRADQQTAELKQAAKEDQGAANALREKLEDGQRAQGRAAYRGYIEAALASAQSVYVWQKYDALTATQLPRARLDLADAVGSLSGGDTARALGEFRKLDQTYLKITALPAALRDERAQDQRRLETSITGSWSPADCASSGHISVAGDLLGGDWPGQGRFSEQILGADEGALYTVAVEPERDAGALYSYAIHGGALEMREFPGGGLKLRLKRC